MATGVFRVTGDVAGAISAATKLYEKIEQLENQIADLSKKAKANSDKIANSMKKAGDATKKAGEKAKQAKQGSDQLTKSLNLLSRAGFGVQRAMTGMSKGLMKIRDYWMAMTDSFRLVTQGITNFGRSLFFFVSIPLVGFMKGMLQTSIQFEDQMVRVGKTTNLWGEELADLTQGIRNLAKFTSTSHVDLATMAEQIGQLGISSKSSIIELVDLFNMMSITTDVSADDVAKNMGKIANAFGWNLNQSTEEVTRLANVINYLENTTAASAGEIVSALYKIASVGGVLDIQAKDAAAFAATLIETGMSAEESGTAVRNLFYYMSKNQDAIYKAMKGYDKYNTVTKVATALNEDFTQVIIDISDAMEGEDDNVQALVASMEIGNLRGGKALAAFGNNFENLAQNIRAARAEWRDANSLMAEYEKAMTSTANQMGLLRNNINDTGITLGQAFLPYVNQIIMVLVPAIQELNDWMGKLDDKTKLLIIGGIMLAIVLGPIVMFIGQMMHGVTLLMMGFGQFIKVIALTIRYMGGIIGGFAKIVKWIPGVATMFTNLGAVFARIGAFLVSSTMGWVAVIVVAVVAILKILSKMGVDVAGFFTNIAKKATEWGEKLMETYGNGLARGFQYVLQVITWIANAIASFFKSASPPKKGPLSTIDKWGGKLMATYLKGFYLADFGILSGVGKIIERYLTAGVKAENMAGALKKVAAARVALSQLIDVYNSTGIIDQGMLNKATQGLGYMSEHVQKLIKLWLEYNRLQQRIKELEEERKDVVRGYQDEVEGISASNMSLEDKVNAIRTAQFNRDSELRAIDKEKAALEEQSDEMQDQLEWQKQFVDAMQDQDSIMERIAAAVEKLGKGLEGFGGGFDDDITGKFEEMKKEADEAIKGLKERLKEGALYWDFFKKGFTGEEVDWKNAVRVFPPEMVEKLQEMYNLGRDIGNVWDTLVTTWETLEQWGIRIGNAWTDVKDIFREIKEFFVGTGEEGDVGGVIGQLMDIKWEDVKQNLIDGIHGIIASVYASILEFLGVTDEGKRSELADRWATILFDIVEIGARIVEIAAGISLAVFEGLKAGWETTKSTFLAWWNDTFMVQFRDYWDSLLLVQIAQLGWDLFQGLWEGFKDWFDENIGNFTTKVEEIISTIKEALGISSPSTIMYDIGIDIIQGLWDGMISLWNDVLAWIRGRINEIPGWLKKLLHMESPSKVMEHLGEMTIKGYWIGMENQIPNVQNVAMSAGAIPVSAMSGAPVGSMSGAAGNISITINDPVVRSDQDLDRLSRLVADRVAKALNGQQSYGGQTNW